LGTPRCLQFPSQCKHRAIQTRRSFGMSLIRLAKSQPRCVGGECRHPGWGRGVPGGPQSTAAAQSTPTSALPAGCVPTRGGASEPGRDTGLPKVAQPKEGLLPGWQGTAEGCVPKPSLHGPGGPWPFLMGGWTEVTSLSLFWDGTRSLDKHSSPSHTPA
jgi:hypothetical protein